MINDVFNEHVLDLINKDPEVRRQVAKESHYLFFNIYFSNYVRDPIAEMHKDIFRITEDQSIKMACILAFRGSGKSTLISTSYVLWSILGMQQKKFVVIICQTQSQARQQMANIKYAAENYELLKSDLGPFREDGGNEEWSVSSLVFQNIGARIVVASSEQTIRGIRHREFRPDLIILDDVEDVRSAKTKENREKLFEWFTREIIPLGDVGTRTIIVGNLVHNDSLMMRIKKKIEAKDFKGVFRKFPFLDEDGHCLWSEKFNTPEKIEEFRKSRGSDIAWLQEYLLKEVSSEDQVVKLEWIKRYAKMPPRDGNPDLKFTLTGVDLAISKEDYADFTAMVSISVFRNNEGDWKIYVHPNPVNEHLDFPEARKRLKELSRLLGFGYPTPVYIESVGYQGSLAQDLRHDGFPAEEFKVHGQDKRMRLSIVTHLIEDGIVLFPEQGAEDLISQLVGFGIENHDDLTDGFAIALHEAEAKMTMSSITFPMPAPTQTQEVVYTEDMRKADELYNNGEIAFRENRIDIYHWLTYQDVVRDVKLFGIPYNVAMRRIGVIEAEDEEFKRKQEENKRKNQEMIEFCRKKNNEKKAWATD